MNSYYFQKKYTFTECSLFFAKMRFFINYIIIQALKYCNILRSVKVYFFGRFQHALKFDKKSLVKRPFDYAQGDKMRTSFRLERSVMEKSQPLKSILK